MNQDKAEATLTIEEAATKFEKYLEPDGPTEDSHDDEQDEAEYEDDSDDADTDEDSELTQDEDEGDEPEDESGEEDESTDDDEDEDEDVDLNRKVTIKVDGKAQKVTLKELRDGYQRQADYSRKTGELAQTRKVIEQEYAQVRQEREHYKGVIDQYQQNLAQADHLNLSQEQWEYLRVNDPLEWQMRKTDLRDRQDQWQALEAQKAAITQQQAAEARKHQDTVLTSEREQMYAKKPEWRDPKVFKRVKATILEKGPALGYSDEELRGATDHRAIIALYDLCRAEKVREKTSRPAQAVEEPKKPMPLGRSEPRRSSSDSDLRKRKQRLATTGSARDLASIFEKKL